MRHQIKPFIVERMLSRKLTSETNKPSIWGTLDLSLQQGPYVERGLVEATTVGDDADDRR